MYYILVKTSITIWLNYIYFSGKPTPKQSPAQDVTPAKKLNFNIDKSILEGIENAKESLNS